jgi:hypothetical protein
MPIDRAFGEKQEKIKVTGVVKKLGDGPLG